MKINFTKKEYRLLVDLLEISDWVLNSHATSDAQEHTQYTDLIQKIYTDSKAMCCDDILEYDPETKEHYATLDYEENGTYRQYVDEFEDNVFWDSLAFNLAQKDLLKQEGEENLLKMEQSERANKIFELQDWYQDEFIENGLDNMKVVKEKADKHH